MKKLLLLLFVFSICTNSFSQDLVNFDVRELMTDKPTANPIGLGADIVLPTNKGYVSLNCHAMINNVYYGIGIGFKTNRGIKGEKYTVINWDDLKTDHVNEGFYYLPCTFDIGYKISKNIVLGGGIGYASKTLFRNCSDKYHILSSNGEYYKTKEEGGKAELKAFATYNLSDAKNWVRFYVRGQYTIITGLSLGVGFDFDI